MSGGQYSGRCLCGGVTFKVRPENAHIGACHCGQCRRWATGPFMGIDCGTSFVADDAANLGVYESSDWAERGFCKICGSSLFYRLKQSGQSYVSVHAIDGLEGIELTDEVFIDEKPHYYSFAQKTKQMTGEELFALFAGQDD